MRLSDVLGLSVHTESGERLGRVHDVRAELTSRSLRVTGLAVGGFGVLERLGLGAPSSALRIRSNDVLEWSRVVRVDRRGIIVKD
ncbi:MAG TPA: PRC-barrel domain-containing protein [Gaiellaceae bacterium]